MKRAYMVRTRMCEGCDWMCEELVWGKGGWLEEMRRHDLRGIHERREGEIHGV